MTTTTIISNFSFSSLNIDSSYSDIDNLYEKLKDFISSISASAINCIAATNDIYDYCTEDSYQLVDLLDSIANSDQQIFTYYFSELEKIISAFKSDYSTSFATDVLLHQNFYTDGNAYLAFKDNTDWFGVEAGKHITDSNSLYELNISLLSNHFISEDDYLTKIKLLFNHIHFHDDLLSTFRTILHGELKDYTKVITHAVRTLHEAIPSLSNNSNDHDNNIQYIGCLSEQLGKTIQCSRQGSNKPHFNFKLEGWPEEKLINCEFHQKINSNDKIRLPRNTNVRIYFGLQSHNNKRAVLLAHIGKHL